MRWLQWATIDLEKGLGGVETHARSLARELSKLGIEHHFSRDPKALDDPSWDVIHTHGSSFSLGRFAHQGNRRAVRIQALHGETLGRMKACREWTWPGGYAAAAREFSGVFQADVILADHPNLSLFRLAKKWGKHCVVASNGWDASDQGVIEDLPPDLQEAITKLDRFWLFVGRGSDVVKGAHLLKEAMRLHPGFKVVAVPGQGFDDCETVLKTGRLTDAQVRNVLNQAWGLVCPSLYEGLPLVVLEALSAGLSVVVSPVGGLVTLPGIELEGLKYAHSASSMSIAEAMVSCQSSWDQRDSYFLTKKTRGLKNQTILPNWEEVARRAVGAVEFMLGAKTSK